MKQRIDWVDIFKGMAIFLVVVGHSGSPLTKYIYLFHMPAFLFISGYTFKPNGKFIDIFFDRFNKLLIPYFSFAFLFSGLQILSNLLNINSILFIDNSKEIYNPIWLFNAITSINYTNPLSGATWFLILLFETIVIFTLLIKMQKKLNFNNIFILSVSLILSFLSTSYIYPLWPKTQLNYFLDLNFLSLFFFTLGYLFREYDLFNRFKINKIFIIATTLSSSIILYYFSNINILSIDFPSRRLGFFPYLVLTSLSGILILHYFSIFIEKIKNIKNILILIGKNSLIILCVHFFTFKLFFILGNILHLNPPEYIKSLTPQPNFKYWLILSIFSLITSLVFGYFIKKSKISSTLFLGARNET